MSNLSDFLGGGGGYDMATHAATGFCKPSIILFDTNPGAHSFTIPSGVTRIRAFVVGAGGAGGPGGTEGGGGGGYSEKEYAVSGGDIFSYVVGTAPGGTSSFNSDISATGGGSGGAGGLGGAGSGGDVNFQGGAGGNNGSGGASGYRFGNGGDGGDTTGGGWAGNKSFVAAGSGGKDGFGIGLLPGGTRPNLVNSDVNAPMYADASSYGCGGNNGGAPGGIGGGGAQESSIGGSGGIGGGGGMDDGEGGFGLVGIEVLEVE